MVVPATRNCLRLAGDTTNLDKLESYLEKYERLKELAATCPSGSCSLIRKLEGEGPKYFAALDIQSQRARNEYRERRTTRFDYSDASGYRPAGPEGRDNSHHSLKSPVCSGNHPWKIEGP